MRWRRPGVLIGESWSTCGGLDRMFGDVGSLTFFWARGNAVTEQEWMSCTEPRSMLEFLRDKASERKFRLFAVACCYRAWEWMSDASSRNAVEAAEKYADGGISLEEWIAISKA